MANITIKKADGTTDVVYTQIVVSTGDSVDAIWRSETSATLRGNRWTAKMRSRDNGPKTGRRVEVDFNATILATVDGREVVLHNIPIKATALVPNMVTEAEASEAVHQGLNFVGNVAIRVATAAGIAIRA